MWLPRSLTTEELEIVRRDGQGSSLYLAIHNPQVIYTAVINQAFTSKDMVVEITYADGDGDLAQVLPGMTLWVGTTPGSDDVGRCRVRKTPTSEVFYIGEESEIPFVDELYLTVVDEFGIWPRHVSIRELVTYMDYDVEYDDQHTDTLPIPIIGPRHVPVWLTEGSVVVSFDGSQSYTLPDTSISSFLWEVPGSTASSDLGTATPTATYEAAGLYRVSCQVTAANGKVNTAYLYVEVFDELNPPITQFSPKTLSGSYSDNGWKFQLQVWGEVDQIKDRAMVTLFSKDYYGTEKISIGQIENRENIIATGWIEGSSIVVDPDGSSVEFTVTTLPYWLKRLEGFPVGIQNTTFPSSAWTNWRNLTVDASLYHLFLWQSTVIPAVDVFLTGDTKYSAEQYGVGKVWEQLNYLLGNTIWGTAGSDRFNRLFCEVDTQLTPPDERTYNTVMSILGKDWQDQVQVQRKEVEVTSQVDLSGVAINISNSPAAIFSLAPGHVFDLWGTRVRKDKLLLSTQAKANELAALKLAWDNHEFEFVIKLAENNRMFDIYPTHQFVHVELLPEDNPQGISFEGNILIREIEMTFDPGGWIQVTLMGENEVFPGNSVDGDIPGIDDDLSFPPTPPFPPPPEYPPIEWPPIVVNPDHPTVVVMASTQGVLYTTNFNEDQPVWQFMNAGLLPGIDTLDIVNLVVTPSGALYIHLALGNKVMRAAGLGGFWTQVAQTSDFGDAVGIIGIGVNPLADDTVAVVAGGGRFEPEGRFGLLTNGVLSLGGSIAARAATLAGITFSNGKWYVTGSVMGVFATPKYWTFSPGGSAGFSENLPDRVGEDAADRYIVASGTGGILFEWDAAAPGGYCLFTSTVTRFETANPRGTQGLAISPVGLIGICNDGAGALYLTTDAGYTWSPLTATIPIGSDVIENCRDNNRFLFGGGIIIRLTLDLGLTYFDKMGNLGYIAPLIDITHIRYIA